MMNPKFPDPSKPGGPDSPENYSFEINFYESLAKRNGKDVRVLEILAQFYTRSGRYTDGLRVDRRIVRHCPENPVAHYNLACSLARRNRKKDAVESLRDAVEKGYRDTDWMKSDEDLESLHDYQPFQSLVKEVETLP